MKYLFFIMDKYKLCNNIPEKLDVYFNIITEVDKLFRTVTIFISGPFFAPDYKCQELDEHIRMSVGH